MSDRPDDQPKQSATSLPDRLPVGSLWIANDPSYSTFGSVVEIISDDLSDEYAYECGRVWDDGRLGEPRLWYDTSELLPIPVKPETQPIDTPPDPPCKASHDPVNHPKHYTSHPSGVECITVTEYMNFNIGNAVKYLWRADLKADAIEDLKKAAWYVNREISKREKEQR